MSAISLIDTNRQWFKASVGLGDLRETERDVAFCSHAVLRPDLFEVSDALLDERFHDNPLVTEQDGIRFYAGAPIALTDGTLVGTLCVIDQEPRQLDSIQRRVLSQLSTAAAQALEGRRALGRVVGLARELEVKVAERTHELREAVVLAEQASEAKTTFLANMSHEIRTPMNGIVGLTYIALQDCIDLKQRSYLEKIHRTGKHLSSVLNNILDFSKIEAGRLELEARSFSMSMLLADLRDQVSYAAEEKGLSFSILVDPNINDAFVGDPLRVAQILRNYIDNAIKFTKSGRVTVRVDRVEDAADGAQLLRFEVADTGIGLTKAECEKLFTAFHQANSSTTRTHGGSGLGLSICRKLARTLGGDAGVESVLHKGSTFWFTATLLVDESLDNQTETSSPADKVLPLEGVRVLLVEDNEINLEVACALLNRVGVKLTCATNGQLALDALATQDFDCVLMDIQMPVLDGLAATRRIRSGDRNSRIPVIALTANASSQDSALCAAAGMNDFVTKPIAPEALYAVVAKWTVDAVLLSRPPSP